jgi:hypothetical protein
MKTTLLALVMCLTFSTAARGWISLLDGSELPEVIAAPPWTYYVDPGPEEGSVQIVDLGGGNMGLQLNSPAHSDGENPGATINHANEYYTFRDEMGVPTENIGAARFRLVEFTPTGKENLLSVTVNSGLDEDGDMQPDGMSTAPAITLVDGNYWIWSYTTNEPILDLGPAVAGEFHEAYVMARNDGTAQVWWDGAMVLDGPVPAAPNFGDYVEFGSGTYWQTTAGTTVDFDWVGWGELTDLPVPPGVAGDYNNNGSVDAADYVLWRDGGTLQNEVATPNAATAEDYDAWKARFGNLATAARGQTSFANAAVPEPVNALLVPVGAWLLGLQGRRVLTRSRASFGTLTTKRIGSRPGPDSVTSIRAVSI